MVFSLGWNNQLKRIESYLQKEELIYDKRFCYSITFEKEESFEEFKEINKDHILSIDKGYDSKSRIVCLDKCLYEVALDKYGTCDITVKHLTFDQLDDLTRNVLKDVIGFDVTYDKYYNKVDVSFIVC